MPKTNLVSEFNLDERQGNAPLFLDREGRWFYEGLEITHGRTCLLFSKNLARDQTGRYYVRVGSESAEVHVEDAPYTVKSVTIQKGPDGLPTDYILHLNDDTQECLASRPLTVNEDNVLYCLVKEGSERARFLRAAYYQVCIQLQYDEKADEYWLPWRETKIRIQPEAQGCSWE
jgi:uncharacterized protein